METHSTGTLELNTDEIDRRLIKVKKHTFRVAAALAGASAVVVMGALSVAAAPTQAHANTVIPEHFGGPVNTSIYSPTATLGMPTLSSSSVESPIPMSASR
jgi:2-methylaconitate cis-trans-isomerase PrpF